MPTSISVKQGDRVSLLPGTLGVPATCAGPGQLG